MKKILTFCFALISFLLVFAQENSSISARLASEDDLLMPIKVWGEVVNPGIYDLPIEYGLLSKYIETGDNSLRPEVRSGDTIMVPPKFGKNFYQSFAALLAIAQSITIMAYYIDRVVETP